MALPKLPSPRVCMPSPVCMQQQPVLELHVHTVRVACTSGLFKRLPPCALAFVDLN